MTQRLRPYLIGLVLLVAGVIVGYSLPSNTVAPKTEIGVVKVVRGSLASENAGFTFKQKAVKGPAVSYTVQDPTPWQAKQGGKWSHHGTPSCLKAGATVTIGVISVRPVGSAPGTPMVVWIECYG